MISCYCVLRGWGTQFTVRAAHSTYATAPWCKLIARAQTNVFIAANDVWSERCCRDVVPAFPPQLVDGRWRLQQQCIWLVSNSVGQCAFYLEVVCVAVE